MYYIPGGQHMVLLLLCLLTDRGHIHLYQILIKLAVEEPGPNWADMSYAHARGQPPISGWMLPESWTREDEEMGGDGGPRRTGILCLRYLTDSVSGGEHGVDP